MPPTSKLGSALRGGQAPPTDAAAPKTKLRDRLANGRRGENVTIPTLGAVFMEMPGARVWQEQDSAVKREMRRLELGDEVTVMTEANYSSLLAMHILSVAARDPDDHAQAFGSLEDWGDVDNDILNIAWHAFGDVRERIDPISLPLSDDDMFAISAAVKKKDGPLLRTFESFKLVGFLTSMADRLSTSPTPSSPSSDSSSNS